MHYSSGMTPRIDAPPTTLRPGIDVPDHRGRTGLDQAGRGLDRNPAVVVRDVEVTSDGWHVLRRTTFDYRRRDGRWVTEQRESYDRGNGATILLYDAGRARFCSRGSSAFRPMSTIIRTAC
ncbi:GDP-mannose pyrophosphatase NudK [Arthrobacter sp. Hiyo8]|nr:GDP-mannose pyrophosphatase NudK [Arthrobacter sp. Hiyo8]